MLVIIGLFRTYPLLGALGIVGAAITAIYILRLIAKVFFGPLDKQWQKLSDVTPLEGTAAAMLVLTLLLVGVYPTYLISLIDSSVKIFLTPFGGA